MDPYLGEIRMFGGNFAPQGWALCNGQLLPISENDALFALIGTTYGGDGQTTFALPDLQGRVFIHQGTNPRTGTTYDMGEQSGTENVTLLTPQLPNHSHVVVGQKENGSAETPNGNYFAQSTNATYSTNAPNATMASGLVVPAGGGQPHDNMMPYLAVNFIIALQGIFPSQN